jgi:phospholipid/cholesterol/gamma-HCH transport system substrate-binding protein
MKFSIRFVDQIVGAFIILALGILIFVIFMLGSSQRWFARDYMYKAYFNSAMGISPNMPVQYKGFTIGHVKSFKLSDDDRVEVSFSIFDIYNDRVREGSLVEVLVSPIGLGNQFMFYPGMGTELVPEWEIIPTVNTPEARRLLESGLAVIPEGEDSINNIMSSVNNIVSDINSIVSDVSNAMNRANTILAEVQGAIEGSDRTSLGRTLGGVETAVSGLSDMAQTLPSDITGILNQLMADLNPIMGNLQDLTAKLSDPSGSVMAILDSEGPMYGDLVTSLDSISGILRNLEKTSQLLPAQFPQITMLLSDLHNTLQSAEDVLIALMNNPLLKGGVPQRRETYPGGARPRDLEF